MKHLIKQYLDSRISRRELLSGLGTLGITAAAANSMAQSLAPFLPAAAAEASADASSASRSVKGTGGALLVAQLKASGIEHIFFNMLVLWMCGTLLEPDWGTRRFLKYYFVCGIGAGICAEV